jgi:hypothetical protein
MPVIRLVPKGWRRVPASFLALPPTFWITA